jgi:hypothetical protein
MKISTTILTTAILMSIAPIAQAQWTNTLLHGTGYTDTYATSMWGSFQYGFRTTISNTTGVRWPGTSTGTTFYGSGSSNNIAINGAANGTAVGRRLSIATVWTNSTSSAVTVPSPSGQNASELYGTTGTNHVGYWRDRAGLWSGSPLVYTDLHPAGTLSSFARAISGNSQVGFTKDSLQVTRACKWTSTAASYVDLHPAGASNSGAYGVSGTTIAGFARLLGTDVAGVWEGPGSIWRAFPGSGRVNAISGNFAVGYSGSTGLLWFVDSGASINLTSLLFGFNASRALGLYVDATGISIVGYATRSTTGNDEARLWKRTAMKVSGNMVLQDTSGSGPAGNEAIGYTMTNGTNTYTGSVNVNRLGGGAYTFNIPFNAPSGAYTLRFKGGTYLAKTYNVNVTGLDLTIAASLRNGDINQDGEVGPSDFEAVVAQFGGVGTADVDNDGEVGPSDFEIIIANFGLGDE